MYYLYALMDPRAPKNYRYIGITKNMDIRYNQHISAHKLKDSSHKNHWIKTLLKENIYPKMVELSTTKTKEEIFFLEIEAIKQYKELGHDLTNIARGGQGGIHYGNTNGRGNKGKPKSKEHGRKIGLAQLGNTRGRLRKGIKMTETQKDKMRIPKEKAECPYCGIIGAIGLLKRYHFDNCIYRYGDCDIDKILRKIITTNGYNAETQLKRNLKWLSI